MSLLLIDGAAGDAQLLDGEQQLVVALDGGERRHLPGAANIDLSRVTGQPRGFKRFSQLEAEKRLLHIAVGIERICLQSGQVRARNSGGN